MAELPVLLKQINKPKDPANLTDLEKKHLPVIEAPDAVKAGEPFQVTVHVGKLLKHPNEPEHHIQYVELFKGYVQLARVDLAAALTEPKVTFTVTLPAGTDDANGGLRAFEKCNMHGVWEATKPIKVE